jgi:hypothetical protein
MLTPLNWTARCGANALNLNVGGDQFESLPEHQHYWRLSCFSSVLLTKFLNNSNSISHSRFLTNPFYFVIHEPFLHSTLCCLDTDRFASYVKDKRTSPNVTEWINFTLEFNDLLIDSHYMILLFNKSLSGTKYHIQWTLELGTVSCSNNLKLEQNFEENPGLNLE